MTAEVCDLKHNCNAGVELYQVTCGQGKQSLQSIYVEYWLPAVDMFEMKTVDCSLTWNLMGMLSNPHFRVKMYPKADGEGKLVLHCEHPTKSGGEPGGWMEREAMEGGGMQQVMEKQSVASTNVDTSKLKTYTPEQVSSLNSGLQCQMVEGLTQIWS